MKFIYRFLVIGITTVLTSTGAVAQSGSGCPNADFSMGTFSNWIGTHGSYTNPTATTAFLANIHTLISSPGIDANTCGGLQILPPGTPTVARLGNNTFGTTAIDRTLSYTITVGPANALFIYKYAVVLHDFGHTASVQPKFIIKLKDATGTQIGGSCGTYEVTAAAGVPGFNYCSTWAWKDWTTVGVDLSPWMGQLVTIEFSTYACNVGGVDPGYAYIAADCRPLSIDVTYCPGDTSVLLVAPPGFATYSWNTNPPVLNDTLALTNQNSGDTLTVTMTSFSNGATCSLSLQAIILPTIIDAGFTLSPCVNNSAFLDTSVAQNGSIQSWMWTFGDGNSSTLQNPVHHYPDTGTYIVTLKAYSKPNQQGCRDSVTLPVQINPKPAAGFSQVLNCIGVPCYFTDTTQSNSTGIQSLAWDFGPNANPATSSQTNPIINFTFPGTYNISLIATNDFGCSDTAVVAVTTANYPHMGFDFSSECAGTAITFTDSVVTDFNDSIVTWQWDMGDGTVYNTQSASHAFQTGGIYNVKLTAYSAVGCLDSLTQYVQVYHTPDATFTALNVCNNEPVPFTNNSSVAPPSSIAQTTWQFGDNTTSNAISPTHFYPGPGSYNVTLTIDSDHGCTGTYSDTVKTFHIPQSDFTFNDECLVEQIAFLNTSLNPADGTIGSVSWDFGDGSPLDLVNYNTSHLYPSAGAYTVTLITYSANLGCSDTISKTVNVHPMPVAGFTFGDTCHTHAMKFTDQSSGQINFWNWEFAPGQNSTLQHPDNLFNGPGNYNVKLAVETDMGCTDSIQKQVTVWPLPVPQFLAMNICEGEMNFFYNQSSIPLPYAITTHMWNFGDGSATVFGKEPVHNYTTAGDYEVILYSVSGQGCIDSIKRTVEVHHNPVPDFVFDKTQDCFPLCVNFADRSTIGGGEQIKHWNWNFSDGGSTSGEFTSYCFTKPGTFSVTLETESDYGCKSKITMQDVITAFGFPVADFIPEPAEATIFDPVITFVNNSINADTYRWSFGDGNYANMNDHQNPRHTYLSVGTYYVTLWVETEHGCTDSVGHLVIIEDEYSLYIPNAFSPNDDDLNDIFRPKGTGIMEFEMEIYDRWGILLFRTDNIQIGWDGKITRAGRDLLAPIDVYVYSIRARNQKGKEIMRQGHFSLVR